MTDMNEFVWVEQIYSTFGCTHELNHLSLCKRKEAKSQLNTVRHGNHCSADALGTRDIMYIYGVKMESMD